MPEPMREYRLHEVKVIKGQQIEIAQDWRPLFSVGQPKYWGDEYTILLFEEGLGCLNHNGLVPPSALSSELEPLPSSSPSPSGSPVPKTPKKPRKKKAVSSVRQESSG